MLYLKQTYSPSRLKTTEIQPGEEEEEEERLQRLLGDRSAIKPEVAAELASSELVMEGRSSTQS